MDFYLRVFDLDNYSFLSELERRIFALKKILLNSDPCNETFVNFLFNISNLIFKNLAIWLSKSEIQKILQCIKEMV